MKSLFFQKQQDLREKSVFWEKKTHNSLKFQDFVPKFIFHTHTYMISFSDVNSGNTKRSSCRFYEPFLISSFCPKKVSFRKSNQDCSENGQVVQSIKMHKQGHPYNPHICTFSNLILSLQPQIHGITSYCYFKNGHLEEFECFFKLDWDPSMFKVNE